MSRRWASHVLSCGGRVGSEGVGALERGYSQVVWRRKDVSGHFSTFDESDDVVNGLQLNALSAESLAADVEVSCPRQKNIVNSLIGVIHEIYFPACAFI